jgi:hypothetical protein
VLQQLANLKPLDVIAVRRRIAVRLIRAGRYIV